MHGYRDTTTVGGEYALFANEWVVVMALRMERWRRWRRAEKGGEPIEPEEWQWHELVHALQSTTDRSRHGFLFIKSAVSVLWW